MPKSEVLDCEEMKAELESLLQTGSLKEILDRTSSDIYRSENLNKKLDENITKPSFRILQKSDTITKNSDKNLPILLMAKSVKSTQNASANI